MLYCGRSIKAINSHARVLKLYKDGVRWNVIDLLSEVFDD